MTNQEFIESILLPNEEWRDVIGYEGRNYVSSLGRMVTIRTYQYKHKGTVVIRELMKPYTAKDTGYKKVSIYKDGKRKTAFVHRIVATAFIPNPNNFPEVDHLNTIRTDNRVENLRWCSCSMNANNPITLQRNRDSHKGQKTTRTKQIVQLKDGEVVKLFESIYDATQHGFDCSGICHVCSGRQKTHKGYAFMYIKDYEALNQ